MLTDEQLSEHDKELNHVNDVLTTVMSLVRCAYPPEDRVTSIVKDACDAINNVQQLRNKLRHLESHNRGRNQIGTDALFRQLEPCILDLDGVQLDSDPETKWRRAYKAPKMMRRQFVSIEFRKRKPHLPVYLYLPPDQINDPRGKCEVSGEWLRAELGSVADLDYIMGLVKQSYNYNLVK